VSQIAQGAQRARIQLHSFDGLGELEFGHGSILGAYYAVTDRRETASPWEHLNIGPPWNQSLKVSTTITETKGREAPDWFIMSLASLTGGVRIAVGSSGWGWF
jgi:hypothetical protein